MKKILISFLLLSCLSVFANSQFDNILLKEKISSEEKCYSDQAFKEPKAKEKVVISVKAKKLSPSEECFATALILDQLYPGMGAGIIVEKCLPLLEAGF